MEKTGTTKAGKLLINLLIAVLLDVLKLQNSDNVIHIRMYLLSLCINIYIYSFNG